MTTAAPEMDQDEADFIGDDSGQAAVLQPETPPATTVINNHITTVAEDAGWVLRVTPEHKCILPTVDTTTFIGSIWKCGECTQNWMVYEKRGKDAGTKALKRISQEKAQGLRDAAAARGNETDPDE